MAYDLIVIGGGPGGLGAALYAARFKMKTLVLAKVVGGELVTISEIANYLGMETMSGYDMAKKMEAQVRELDVEIKVEEVIDLEKGDTFKVRTKEGTYEAKAIVFATGTERRKLGVPGEEEYTGKGVSYCATCDAPMFKDKVVGVVGGSDAAGTEAILLAKYAKKVYIIYRKEEIRTEPVTKDRIAKTKNIEIINNTNVAEIRGEKFVNNVLFDTGKELALDGLFIEIGGVPSSVMAKKIGVELDKRNQVIIGKMCETNVPGVFAAGDVTDYMWKQAIVASAQGALSAFSAYNYTLKLKK